MDRRHFIKAMAGVIAETKTNAKIFPMLVELLYRGECRPTESSRNGVDDRTGEIIEILQGMGLQECPLSCRGNRKGFGYFTGNDAPRGGQAGNFIKIHFEG